MSRRPKDIGTDAERAVARYLQTHGWPHAERRALRGTADAGDITGTPGICWEVKARSRPVGDRQIDDWLDDLADARARAHADIGILVVRRPGYSAARVGHWWAYTTAATLFDIHAGRHADGFADGGSEWDQEISVRLNLADAARLLRIGGWGDLIDGDPHVWDDDPTEVTP